MKFRFRLERALQFARLKETTKKSEIAVATQRVGVLQDRHRELAESQRAFLETIGRRPDLAWAPFQNPKIGADLNELRRLEQAIASARLEIDRLRGELARLAMRRKALESLREKRYQEFRVGETRREQHAIDEAFRALPKK